MKPNRFYFALINLLREAKGHIGIAILSIILIFFISSIILFSNALQQTILETLKAQPDFVVQKIKDEVIVPIKNSFKSVLLIIFSKALWLCSSKKSIPTIKILF